jgi:hypothetical protein
MIPIPSDYHEMANMAHLIHLRHPQLLSLFRVLEQHPVAVAGGFVRDFVLGIEARDLDILVENEPSRYEMHALTQALGLGDEAAFELLFQPDASYMMKDDDRQSSLFGVWKAAAVDLLHVSDIIDRVNDFPDSTSKILLTTEGIFAHPEFVHAHERKVLTYRAAAGRRRFDRLVAKFPTYTTVVNGEFAPEEVTNG